MYNKYTLIGGRALYYFGKFLVNNGKVNDLQRQNPLVLRHDNKNPLADSFMSFVQQTGSGSNIRR